MAMQSQLLFGNQSHYYLCHYKSKAAGSDRLSQSLLRFKSGCDVDVEAWCSCAVEELKKLSLPENTLVLRVLSSSEVTTQEVTGLDRLGARLQQELKVHYQPALLSKTRTTRPVKQLSRAERSTELADAYLFNTPYNIELEWSTVLVLDDILTTGATLQAITKAIRQKLPKIQVLGFTLAFSERTAPLNTTISLQSNAYKWQPGGWIMQETDPDYISLESLKTAIRS
ncbi:MAG: hypothetical protein J0L67_04325 [Cytophagales bacterium]|nr:hypothetical protein [Cytophagales bacterium]